MNIYIANIFIQIIIVIFIIGVTIFILGWMGCFFLTAHLKKINEIEKRLYENTDLVKIGPFWAFNYWKQLIRSFVSGWLRLSLSVTSRIPSHTVRNMLYRRIYHLDLAKTAVLYSGSQILSPQNIHIGEGSIIGDNSILDGRNGIIIGEHVNLSTGVWIWTLQHDPQCPLFSCRGSGGSVTIGNRAWISCRAIILPGITIGEGGVVAAGAVVTKNVEPFTIVAGVPAKCIGMRSKDLIYEFDGRHSLFL